MPGWIRGTSFLALKEMQGHKIPVSQVTHAARTFALVSSYCLAALDAYKKVHPDRMGVNSQMLKLCPWQQRGSQRGTEKETCPKNLKWTGPMREHR